MKLTEEQRKLIIETGARLDVIQRMLREVDEVRHPEKYTSMPPSRGFAERVAGVVAKMRPEDAKDILARIAEIYEDKRDAIEFPDGMLTTSPEHESKGTAGVALLAEIGAMLAEMHDFVNAIRKGPDDTGDAFSSATCRKCGENYAIHEGCDPTPLCDACAQRCTPLLLLASDRLLEQNRLIVRMHVVLRECCTELDAAKMRSQLSDEQKSELLHAVDVLRARHDVNAADVIEKMINERNQQTNP